MKHGSLMLLVLESETLFLIRQKFSNAAVLPRAIWVFKLVTAPTGRMLQTNSWQGLDCLELFSPFPDLPCCPAVNNAIMTYYFLFPKLQSCISTSSFSFMYSCSKFCSQKSLQVLLAILLLLDLSYYMKFS